MRVNDKTFPVGRIGVGSFDDLGDFAEITVWGRTTTGQTTNSNTARVQIDFADFGDVLTTCPITVDGSSPPSVVTRTDSSVPPTSRATTTGVSGERWRSNTSRAFASCVVRLREAGL